MVNYILFDVDNTLYPASCGIGAEMIRRMNIFVSDFLDVSVKKAAEMRRDRDSALYDSTLDWLQKKYSFDNPEKFFKAIHPEDLENWFPVNLDLKIMLKNLKIPFSVLTNSSIEHAVNVTDYLGITLFFENIFDLKFNNFKGKPNKSAYINVLDALGKKAKEVLFIDDVPSYLQVFKDMGGNVLLVDEDKNYEGSLFPSISKITDLLNYLQRTGISKYSI